MQQLAVTDVQSLIDSASATGGPAPLLLDVREPWEFALAAIHVEGAATVNLPMGSIAARLAELDAAQPVVCVCHHGMRSAQVVACLERSGFASVYNLAGGIDAWSTAVDARVPRY